VRSPQRTFVACLLTLATIGLVLPAEALAQRHHHHGRSRVVVGVGVPYYSPFYSYYGWWGPWGPWGYWAPPYGYYGAYDYASEVRVMATPREAEVYVDGYLVGTVDDFDGWSQRLRLQPGEHDIELFLEGYRSVKQRMLFRPSETYKVRATLERVGPGEEPSTRPVPAPGTELPRQDVVGTYSPSAPEPRPQPRDARGFGTLAVRVQPADAEIRVDGEVWDRPAGDSRLTVELSAGTHRVEVRKSGHVAYESTVQVRSGEVTTLNVSLPVQP
jgi:hypothetical protein